MGAQLLACCLPTREGKTAEERLQISDVKVGTAFHCIWHEVREKRLGDFRSPAIICPSTVVRWLGPCATSLWIYVFIRKTEEARTGACD